MAKHQKVYRFRMRPTQAQAHALNRVAGARRFIWNWGLGRRQEHYKATEKTLPLKTLMAELTVLKQQPGMEWLNEADSQAWQQVLKDLYRAYDNHFNPKMRARFPRFKSRKRDRARFRVPQRVKLDEGQVHVPKIGFVRIHQSQPVPEPTKSVTFKRDARGHWFVTLTVEFEMPEVALPPPDPAKVVGIDLGLIDFATTSDGAEPIPAPKFYRKAERKIRKANRTFSRRKKGSKRRAKARIKLARAQQKAAEQRKDFLHKTTTKLVHDHDGICIEDLGVKGLARTKLAKSFHDAALGEFRRQLTYKCQWNLKHLVPIDRFFPSSKLCNRCGAVNHELTLSDREWTCPSCGAHHKRDFLAACNIRDEGLRILAAGQAGESKRSGRDCKSQHAGLVSSN
jgi:putative transposase